MELKVMKRFIVYSFVFLFVVVSSINAAPKPKLMWFDATGNYEMLCNSDSVCYYLDKVKQLGFTDAVIDVKPISGEVLFNSKIAPQLKDWQGYKRTSSFDILELFIAEAHKRNLKVHASLNTFVEGHNYVDRGPVYVDRQQWQSINYTDSGMVPISKQKHKYSAMTNPANREVQLYEISILKELVSNYPELDGLILDRVRYDCVEADFSDLSRGLFEKYINAKVEKYPDDIFRWGKDEKGISKIYEGKLFQKWIEWRASVIYNFIVEAKAEVKKINPKISFGDYTGAWYPTYYELGVNWASKNYNPYPKYYWATENYKKYGYAEQLDLYTTGCYFFEVTKDEVAKLNEINSQRTEAAMKQGREPWYSVEGSIEMAQSVTMNAVPIYGGVYVGQYKEKNSPEQFAKAVAMCLKKSDGLMVFDIVHLIHNNWWDAMEKGIKDGEKE